MVVKGWLEPLPVGTGGGAAHLFGVGVAEDGDGEGVVEDQRLGIVDLVGGAAHGYAEGGAGWLGFLHEGFL